MIGLMRSPATVVVIGGAGGMKRDLLHQAITHLSFRSTPRAAGTTRTGVIIPLIQQAMNMPPAIRFSPSMFGLYNVALVWDLEADSDSKCISTLDRRESASSLRNKPSPINGKLPAAASIPARRQCPGTCRVFPVSPSSRITISHEIGSAICLGTNESEISLGVRGPVA